LCVAINIRNGESVVIILRNPGEIELDLIKTMGVNVKESDNSIGFFGTGLKYAIAVFLREGVNVVMHIGENKYEFYTEEKTIRNKTFSICAMRGPYDAIQLGFTTDLGKNWEVWQAYREIHSNCLDEGGVIFKGDNLTPKPGYTTISIDIDIDYSAIFLQPEPESLLFASDHLDIYGSPSEHIYYRGIRAKDLTRKSMFTYNIKKSMSLTEDRLLAYDWAVEEVINDAVASMADKEIIKEIATAGADTYEYSLSMGYNNTIEPGETFMEVVSENKGNVRHSVNTFYSQALPKPELTKQQRARKIINEFEDIAEGYDLTFSFDRDTGVITIESEDLIIE